MRILWTQPTSARKSAGSLCHRRNPLFSVIDRICTLLLAGFAAAVLALPAQAARIGILSNQNAVATAADFTARLKGHTFTPVDVSTTAPTLPSLTGNFDAVLLFEDGLFANAPNVGNVVAKFAELRRPVILASFYEQDRTGTTALPAHGWGALETLDANTSDGTGAAYAPRTLNPASIVVHPLTYGVSTLTAHQFAGGNRPKPDTIVLARWAEPNALGEPDPAIALRITRKACVIHIAIAADYASYGTLGTVYTGDFYRLWQNAFDFAAASCVVRADQPVDPIALPPNARGPVAVPTLTEGAIVLLSLLLGATAVGGLRRRG